MKAPACAAAHFNLGVVLEKAGAFEKARQALLRYLELTPNAADAAAVRKKTYELEYLAREGGRLGTAVAVPSQLSSPWAKLEGVWCRINTCHDESQVFDVTVKGKELHMVMRPYYFHVFNCRLGSRDEYVGAISDDGAIRGTRKMGNKRFEPRCAAGGEPINQWNYQTGPVTGRVMAQGTIIEFQFDQWVQGSRLPTIFKFRRR
jgi:tetratricopeptide (TPR) repeat protein